MQTTIIFHHPGGRGRIVESYDSRIAALTRLARMTSPWARYVRIDVHKGDSDDPLFWAWDSARIDSTVGANRYARALARSWRAGLEYAALLAFGLDDSDAESESLARFWAESGNWESDESAALTLAVLRLAPEWSGNPSPGVSGDPLRLARQFAKELESDISAAYGAENMPTIFDKINRENAKNPPGCASHSFVDSNVAMNRAFIRVTGRAPRHDRQSDADWINRAWDSARKAEFWRAGFETPYSLIVAQGRWVPFAGLDIGESFAVNGGVWVKWDSLRAAGIWPACLPESMEFEPGQMVARESNARDG